MFSSTILRATASSLLLVATTAFVAPATAQSLALASREHRLTGDEEALQHYRNGRFVFDSDHLYRQVGTQVEMLPVWAPENAQVIAAGQMLDGTWRVYLRTESGVEGFVEVARPEQLRHFLKPGTCPPAQVAAR